MADPDKVRSAQEAKNVKSLLALREAVRSPAERLRVNSALGEVCEALGRWEAATEAWRECVVCSEGDPRAWERMGIAAEKAGRLPLAVASLQTAYELSADLRVLLKVAQARLRLHDYANALTLATFISSRSGDIPEAASLRTLVLDVLQGRSLYSGDLMTVRDWNQVCEVEKVVCKVPNLFGLAKALRKYLDSEKPGAIYIFTRSPLSKDTSDTPPRPKPPFKAAHRLRSLCEDIKKEVFAHCGPIQLLPLGTDKLPSPPPWKARCSAEPALEQFFTVEWTLQTAAQRLVTELCGNRPRPSAALSGELAWETLQVYLSMKRPMELKTEALTLFELAMIGPEYPETLEKLYSLAEEQKGGYITQELQLRYKYVQAWFYYHTAEQQTVIDTKVDALITAYAILNNLEESIGDRCYFFWWHGKLLSRSALHELKGHIEDEVRLSRLGQVAKEGGSTKEMLGVLGQLCELLAKRCSRDDPAFYWHKLKLVLRPLLKSPLSPPSHLLLTQHLSRYMAVLQCNFDDGQRVSREIDLRFLLKSLSHCVLRKQKSGRTGFEGYLVIAAANIVRERKDLFSELPFVVRRFGLQNGTLAKFFIRFHALSSDFVASDKSFHFSLCKAYEKPVFCSNDPRAAAIIYSQLYGFSVLTKDCPCGLGKFPPPDDSYPRSVGKLRRLIDYAARVSPALVEFGIYFPQTYDKVISPALARCAEKVPDLLLTCTSMKSLKKIVLSLLSGGDFQHEGCCPELNRIIAERFYQRFASDSFEAALKKEEKGDFLSLLDVAEEQAEKLIVVNPRNWQSWLLLGQVYLHKWMAGYFDAAIVGSPRTEFEGCADDALKCFKVLDCLKPASQDYVLLARGLILFLRYRLTGLGLFEAEKSLTTAIRRSHDSASLEALIISGLVELHIKSEECQALFHRVSADTNGKYEFLCLIADYKINKSEENWAKLDRHPRSHSYAAYVLSKGRSERFEEELFSFVAKEKLFETKVLDRVCAFERKKVRMALRGLVEFEEKRDLGRMLNLCKALRVKSGDVYEKMWERGARALCRMIGDMKDVSEMKLYYELLEHISLTDSSIKLVLLTELSAHLPHLHSKFGVETCEALKSTKRRRKK